MNTKIVTPSFKRQFLPQFSTKSRFLPLRDCGIERGRGRTQEKWERGVWIVTRMLKNVKNTSFYRRKFHNRPIKTIDGYDETIHHGPFQLSRDRRIVIDGNDLIRQ